jgi:hypothetical protein
MAAPTGHPGHTRHRNSRPRPGPVRRPRIPRPRVAVLGAGMIAGVHVRSARAAGADVVGVLASSPERSRAAAGDWQVDVAYPDVDAVLNDDRVDVVHICTPNHLHVAQARGALLAGKHVVCEKPIATSAADALAARRHRHGRAGSPPCRSSTAITPWSASCGPGSLAGDFGPWQLLHGSYLQDWLLPPESTSWRVDPAAGGPSRAFADIGSHWFDLVEWVAGVRIAEVLAETATTVAERLDAGRPDVLRRAARRLRTRPGHHGGRGRRARADDGRGPGVRDRLAGLGRPEEPAVAGTRRRGRQRRLRPGTARVLVARLRGPHRDGRPRSVVQRP